MLFRDAGVFASDNGAATRPQGCCAARWHATVLRAALDPGGPYGPWEQGKRAGPRLPRGARVRQGKPVLAVITTTEKERVGKKCQCPVCFGAKKGV
jgi:hypothetical protein